MATGITILGSTGSIGTSTLDVISRNRDRYSIKALTANTDVDTIERQCKEWKPRYAVMFDQDAASRLEDRLKKTVPETLVIAGVEGLEKVARLDDVQVVVAGIVGAAGLLPSLSAANAGKRVLLANKEALVMSGRLFMDAIEQNGAELLPVDSEHNAIFQCMPASQAQDHDAAGINRILLTASGGPFRTLPMDDFSNVTPKQAIDHPNWQMGPKISVDSATMMNKGLEVIEAYWLFDMPADRIDVVIHPQSVIHSMVSYSDGSVLAQLGNPDMRTPIAHALAWPQRIESGVEPLDIFGVAKLEFERPDHARFPCLRLCYQAMERGGTATIVLNAANEVAVDAFLDERIPFMAIPGLIEQALANAEISDDVHTLESIISADMAARSLTKELIAAKRYI